jgi:hypothetical protein
MVRDPVLPELWCELAEGRVRRRGEGTSYSRFQRFLVRIRAGLDGYLESVQEVDVTTHGSHPFELQRSDHSGTYTLTIIGGDAASPCSGDVPEAAQRRVYTARVEHTGTRLQVFLSGATFGDGGDNFAGAIMPTGDIRFVIRPEFLWDYEAFDLVEHISGGPAIIVQGVVNARSTPAGIVGLPADPANS